MYKRQLINYPIINFKSGELLYIEQEKFSMLQKIIETLPPKRLAIFKLRYYEGLDNPTIAKQLKISINTVKVHLAKARLYLKENLPLHEKVFPILMLIVII